MDRDEHIGRRVATERKVRGLTQRQLADRAHLSHSLLAKVESGHAPASAAFVSCVARALGVEQGRLTGQPYYSGERRVDAVHDLVPELRREMQQYGLPPAEDCPAPPLPELAARVAECSDLVYAVRYAKLGALLPGLLADLRAAAHGGTGAARGQVMLMLAESYDNAKRLAYDLGYADLGALAVSLEERAAAESGDPLLVAVAYAVRGWLLTGNGAYDAAHRLLVGVLDDLDDQAREATPQRWTVWGFLHLQAALACARMGDGPRTWEHYSAGQHAAASIGRHAAAHLDGDPDHYRLTVGPANTAIWGVGLAVELMDGATAVARAQHVVIPPHLPRCRAGHHFLDLARGYLYHGDTGAALRCLLTARRIAPQQVRYNPMARETVYALARAERRSSDSLRGLVTWMGLQD